MATANSREADDKLKQVRYLDVLTTVWRRAQSCAPSSMVEWEGGREGTPKVLTVSTAQRIPFISRFKMIHPTNGNKCDARGKGRSCPHSPSRDSPAKKTSVLPRGTSYMIHDIARSAVRGASIFSICCAVMVKQLKSNRKLPDDVPEPSLPPDCFPFQMDDLPSKSEMAHWRPQLRG